MTKANNTIKSFDMTNLNKREQDLIKSIIINNEELDKQKELFEETNMTLRRERSKKVGFVNGQVRWGADGGQVYF